MAYSPTNRYGVKFRNRFACFLGTFHPYKHMIEVIFRHKLLFFPFFAPLIHFTQPRAIVHRKSKLAQAGLIFLLHKLAYPSIRPRLTSLVQRIDTQIAPNARNHLLSRCDLIEIYIPFALDFGICIGSDYDVYFKRLIQSLHVFAAFSSPPYFRVTLLFALQLQYLYKAWHPMRALVRYHLRLLNEEDGETSLSLLSRSIGTGPGRAESKCVNDQYVLIHEFRKCAEDFKEELDLRSFIPTRRRFTANDEEVKSIVAFYTQVLDNFEAGRWRHYRFQNRSSNEGGDNNKRALGRDKERKSLWLRICPRISQCDVVDKINQTVQSLKNSFSQHLDPKVARVLSDFNYQELNLEPSGEIDDILSSSPIRNIPAIDPVDLVPDELETDEKLLSPIHPPSDHSKTTRSMNASMKVAK